jgi:AAA+ ATPase superfamily predicted ATPase
MFVDREKELGYLEDAYKSKKSEFFIVFGRRRIGKTALIKEFGGAKRHLYFLAKKQKISLEIERFVERIGEELGIYIKDKRNLESVFKELAGKLDVRKFQDLRTASERSSLDGKQKIIITIDEFTYWVEQDSGILSEFQLIWDENLSQKNVFLVLTGSAMSVMESDVMGVKSPIYGRRTGQILVHQLPLFAMKYFLPSYSFRDLINVYGVTGGVPYYLQEFSDKLDFRQNLLRTVFNKSNILSMEAEILLREELREIHIYFAILRSILEGATSTNEIATKSQVDMTNINKYLRVLMQLKLIDKDYPVIGPAKSKNFLYHLSDNYMRFWLKYYYYNESEIEENAENVVDSVLADYENYIGRYVFEGICKNAFSKLTGFKYSKIGRWWSGEEEIDLVAINESNNEICFAECKWRNKKTSLSELQKLIEKAKKVVWRNNNRKEYFVFFSCSGFDNGAKEFAARNRIKIFELKDIEKALYQAMAVD